MNNTLGNNKTLYKLFLIFAKYSSYVYAIIQLLGLICFKFNIIINLFAFIGGCSVITLCLLFLISFVFKFCLTHRLPLYYTLCVFIITILDKIFLFGSILRIYFIILGIFILLYIAIWFKNKDNPKVDHIKQLCESYAECNCK
jgi:hypothetical protein